MKSSEPERHLQLALSGEGASVPAAVRAVEVDLDALVEDRHIAVVDEVLKERTRAVQRDGPA
eukprot:2464215-Alexandrium_andersonii.AAC.1